MRRLALAALLLLALSGCSGGGGGGGGGSDYPWHNPPGPRRHTPDLPRDPWSDFAALGAAGLLVTITVRRLAR